MSDTTRFNLAGSESLFCARWNKVPMGAARHASTTAEMFVLRHFSWSCGFSSCEGMCVSPKTSMKCDAACSNADASTA